MRYQIFRGITDDIVVLIVLCGLVWFLINRILNYRRRALKKHVRVIGKRADESSSVNSNNHRVSSTSYYVTFETDSRQILELRISRSEYEIIMKDDSGNLMYQSGWVMSFDKDM